MLWSGWRHIATDLPSVMVLPNTKAEAAIPGSIVAPHHALQGLLYFDLQGQFDLLSTAHLYIPDVRALEKNHPLLYFEIDLSR